MTAQVQAQLRLSGDEVAARNSLRDAGLLFQVEELARRLAAPFSARDVWNLFSIEEREHLGGDFRAAFWQHGTIGIWMLARAQANRFAAVVELVEALELVPSAMRRRLWHCIGPNPPAVADPACRPHWDSVRGELKYQGETIRQVRSFAKPSKIHQLLDEFESRGFPAAISSPFDSLVINKIVKSLNTGLRRICFHVRGGGVTVLWCTRD